MPPSRDRRPARHRGSEPVRTPAPDRRSPDNLAADAALARDGDLESYLAALAPDAVPAATELTGRFGSAQVFQLRLPALRIEQLRRIAEERGVSPGALAVDWVIDRLDREDTPTGPLPVLDQAVGQTGDELRRRGFRLGRR